MIEWRKPELDYIEADCSALVRAAVKNADSELAQKLYHWNKQADLEMIKNYLNRKYGYGRERMLYEEFTRLTKCESITYTFYKDVIEPMYIAAPEEISKETFCFMLDERYLLIAQQKYFERKCNVSTLENERCKRLAHMLHDMALSFDELKDNPYRAGSKSWDLWNCTIHHLEDLKND